MDTSVYVDLSYETKIEEHWSARGPASDLHISQHSAKEGVSAKGIRFRRLRSR